MPSPFPHNQEPIPRALEPTAALSTGVRASPLPAVPCQRPDGRPTPDRAPCPEDLAGPFLAHGARGKGTQHFLVVLTYYCEVRVLSRFSGVRLFLTPWTSPPGSSVHGIFQLRLLEWVAVPSSRQSPRPRALARVSLRLLRLRRVLYHWGHLD